MKKLNVLAASVVAALAGTAYSQTNLLANGDFETGAFTPEWAQFGDPTFDAVGTSAFGPVHSGTYAAHFGAIGAPSGITQQVIASPGQTVLVDFWYQALGGGPNFFDCTFDGTSLVSFTNDTSNTSWTHFSFPVTVVNANPTIQFSFQNDPSYDYLDDVHVYSDGFGACCLPDATCTLNTAAGCSAASGVYRGDGMTCAVANCASLQGACCLVSGTCVVSTTSGCVGQNGLFRGVGSACATANCPTPSYTPIALNYNFNGLVHGAAEQGTDNLNNPNGYRSIADRGLMVDGSAGSLNGAPLADPDGVPFTVVTQAGVLDIVHLGDRQYVANGARAWGTGTNNGAQPLWLPVSDQTTPQTTDASALHAAWGAQSSVSVLYQVSDSGGHFDMVLTFTDQSTATVTLSAPDWFGSHAAPAPGPGVALQRQLRTYTATQDTDLADPTTNNLNVIEGVVSTASLQTAGMNVSGKTLSSVTFQNPISNANYPNSTPATGSGFAIIAATMTDVTTGGSACYANCDGSTALPFLNVNDFICFQTRFAAGNSYANCDHSTTPPILNVNDFICFQTRFAAGCSAP